MTIAATASLSLRERLNYYSAPAANGCRIWTGGLDKDGYGQMWWKGKRRRASKLSYEEAHGPLPAGILACHTCDIPACIDLDHLFPGTSKQNTRDMLAKNRHAKGERAGSARLTADKVRAIRSDGRTIATIAKEYGIAQTTVGFVKRRITWSHV